MIDGPGLLLIQAAFPERKLRIEYDPRSPWLGVTVEPAWGEEATRRNAERKFAIWRNTQKVYKVNRDETVADDPTEQIRGLVEAHDTEEAPDGDR